MPGNLLLSLAVWLIEILLVTSLVSDAWLRSVQRREEAEVVQFLGKTESAEIRRDADRAFDALFVRTGVQETVRHYFIPTETERQSSIGLEDVGRENLFPFLADRLQVVWDGVAQTLRRFYLVVAWWPFAVATVVPFAWDGLIRRKIKQSNFDYSSPLAHRFSLYAILGTGYLLMVGLTLPFAVPPVAIPMALAVVALAANVYLAHTQKRV
jgi:hypothetical protein